MKNILFINACVRPNSRTYQLAQAVLNGIEGNITEIVLENLDLEPLNHMTLQQREADVHAGDYSSPMFQHSKQFAQADIIVLAAPYWDLSFPAIVKIYLEAVSVLGLTFVYTPQGRPQGLCRAEKLIYVTTAGGMIQDFDFGFEYVKALAQNLFGIPTVQSVRCEGLDLMEADVEALLKKAQDDIVRKQI